MTYIFDACALLALLKREEGADKVKTLLDEAQKGKSFIYMNIVNLIEINYCFQRVFGKEKTALILEQIYTLPISFIEIIDDIIFAETSRIKACYAIPLGDALGLATSIKMNGTFVTGDHSDFEEIEKAEAVPFFWFR